MHPKISIVILKNINKIKKKQGQILLSQQIPEFVFLN